jgi:ADP-ribose pyrophosphatase YjhB (NUDIX family)
LEEETAVADVYLEQLYTFGDPDRDPLAESSPLLNTRF